MATLDGNVVVDVGEIVKELTVTIECRGIKKAMIRLVLGSWIIRFGAWVAGVKVVNLE